MDITVDIFLYLFVWKIQANYACELSWVSINLYKDKVFFLKNVSSNYFMLLRL